MDILCERCNLRGTEDCKVMTEAIAAKQNQMVVCDDSGGEKKQESKGKVEDQWWELKQENRG